VNEDITMKKRGIREQIKVAGSIEEVRALQSEAARFPYISPKTARRIFRTARDRVNVLFQAAMETK
jgi:hypothetical protein